jgi:hypothetical protein
MPHKLCIFLLCGFQYVPLVLASSKKQSADVWTVLYFLCGFLTTNSCLEASITKLIYGLGLVGYYQTTMTTNVYSVQLLKIFVNAMSYYFYYNRILFRPKPIMHRPWTRPHWFLVRHFDSWLNHRPIYHPVNKPTCTGGFGSSDGSTLWADRARHGIYKESWNLESLHH